MKIKSLYTCANCKYESPKWIGRCPSCNAWNSFSEAEVRPTISRTPHKVAARETSPLTKPTERKLNKIRVNIEEFDRVIGEGILPGSITLLSGEPGIGKSTLTLQIANNLAKQNKVLIISGEESVEQIANRAERLKLTEKNLHAINEYNLETILETIKQENPGIAIIDSIQVISSLDIQSSAGTISQIRYCTEQLMELAKKNRIPIILIGHVNKEGNLAGPKVLEHLVDTVLQLEGDRYQQFRILRAIKNRFGACSEVGIFEMDEMGLIEVKNPSEHLLEGRKENAIGSAITVAVEGTRPFLVEVQALVSTTHFGYPKRTANGFDLNRLQILTAVLEKYAKLNLQNQDIFINVVGGIKLNEPAADLAVALAISSSYLKKPIPKNSVIFGECGLSGELRKVIHEKIRIKEAEKLGFKNFITSEEFKEVNVALTKLS